jgi:hypothetical protein
VPEENAPYSLDVTTYLFSILQIGEFKEYRIFGLSKIELDGTLGEIHLSHFTVSSLEKWLIKKNSIIVEKTLDLYYAATGILRIIHDLIHSVFLMIKRISNRNLYCRKTQITCYFA